MGRKSLIQQYNMLDGQSVNMSGNITSNITNVEHLDKLSIHCSWTAGPVGTFKLQARNGGRYIPQSGISQPKIDDQFYDLDFGASMDIIGSDSEIQIVLTECPFTDIRLVYTATSGSAADLKALISAKTVGN